MESAARLDELAQQFFDAFPAPAFIVDEDVKLQFANKAARSFLGSPPDSGEFRLKRLGEIIHCVGAEGPGGCGRQERCTECVVRRSVRNALATGSVDRAKSFMIRRGEGGAVEDVLVLVSASPIDLGGARHVVLTLENVSDPYLRDDLKRMERVLQENEKRLRIFVEYTPAAVAMFDREMRYLVVSRRFATDYRVGPEDLLGRSHYEVFPEVPERWREIHRRCLAGNVEKCAEDPFPRPDGTLDWVRWEVRPWRDADGEVGGVILFSEVITEWKLAEDRLAAERDRLAVTLRSIGDAVIATDVAGHVTLLNWVAENLTGWKNEEALGRPVEEVFRILSQETRAPLASAVDQVVRGGIAVGLPHRTALVSRDGRERPIADSAAPIRDARGEITGVVLVFRDQTEERRAELVLLESEARLRLLAEALPQLVWTTNTEGRLDYFNQRWRDYTGQAPGEEDWEPVIHPEDRERVAALWRDAVLQQRDFDVEHRIRRADGEFRWFLRRAIRLPDSPGKSRWFGTCTDIHDLKVSQEVLRKADRMKADFIAMASHEFRTPLAALRLQMDLMERSVQKGMGHDEKIEHQVAVMNRQIDRINGLLEVLLDASRIDAGRFALDLSRLDLAEVVGDVVQRFEREAADAGTALRLHSHSVSGLWDRKRLDQIITNLVSNAIKYGNGQAVEVDIEESGATAILTVRDHGIGIPAESQLLVFERFERAANAQGFQGLGLGLWIAKQLVEAHGGKISIASAPGVGSTFTVALPRG